MKAFAALRLPPLVLAICCLLAVPLLVFSQVGSPTDRYSLSRPGTGATHGWTYYGCAKPEIIYGNNRIEGIKTAREQALDNAEWNMRAIDQFEPPPTPPPIPTTRKQALKQVPEWIQFGVELTVHTIDQFVNYDRDEIMTNINAYFDDKIERTDAYLQDVTTICAGDQNDASRSNDSTNGMADKYVIAYGIKYLGVNSWMAYPTRTIVRTKVTVIGPLDNEEQEEQDAG